jgi:hypothetical protein
MNTVLLQWLIKVAFIIPADEQTATGGINPTFYFIILIFVL